MTYSKLKVGQAFKFTAEPDGRVYVRCRGGYRPGCGGKLVSFNYPTMPVFLWGAQ